MNEVSVCLEILFHKTISVFHLAVYLGVVGRRGLMGNTKVLGEGILEGQDKLRAAVRNNIIRAAMEAIYCAEKMSCKFVSFKGGAWDEMSHFC